MNVNLGPPPIVVAQPPEVVMMPSTGVYFVPGVEFDIFFYNGYWWSPRGDRWYRARAYNGPWRVVSRRGVPGPVYGVPRDYRRVYMHERHIPYGQWRKEHRGGHPGEAREHRGGPPRGEFRGEHGGGPGGREHGERGGHGHGEGRGEHEGHGR
ncbi:hypothetical protein [Geomonas sp. Red276]